VPLSTAFFGASATTAISSSAVTVIGGFTFAAGAPAYTFTNSNLIDIIGAGFVTNGANVTINNIASGPNHGRLYFENNSTAANITITNNGSGTTVTFLGANDAGTATINNLQRHQYRKPRDDHQQCRRDDADERQWRARQRGDHQRGHHGIFR
jgi:hypothetical protein